MMDLTRGRCQNVGYCGIEWINGPPPSLGTKTYLLSFLVVIYFTYEYEHLPSFSDENA